MRTRSSVLLAIASLLSTVPLVTGAGAVTRLEGYAWPQSAAPGDTVGLYVSTDAATYDVKVLRLGLDEIPVLTRTGLPGFVQAMPGSAWAGCNWQRSTSVVIPPGWTSGVYAARFTAANYTSHAIFVVREAVPGSTARVLLQCSVNTWQAYDTWGGKCLYDYLSTGGRAHVVSFERPYIGGLGLGLFGVFTQPLIAWLESEGYAVAYCTDIDTHADPALLPAYDIFLIVGHDEYWSSEMRDHVDAFVAGGGNVAVLGGDTCWWQVRYSSGLDQLICYKDAALDPLYGVTDSLVTVAWPDPPVNRPGNTTIGASRLFGGYPADTSGNYVVEQAGHWVFEGTGVTDGEPFGGGSVVGIEVDGADFVRENGVPVPTGSDGTPAGFAILGTAPSTNGHATMGLLQTSAGAVFNGASMTWATALANDPVTARITENVLGGLVSGSPFPGDPGDVVLDDLHWGSTGATVQVSFTFRNADALAPSRGVHGAIEGRPLGSFAGAGVPVASFDLASIPAGQTVTTTIALPRTSLPPSAIRLVPGDGGEIVGCPHDTSWAGGLTARWRVTGTPDSIAVARDVASLLVCPGGGIYHLQVSWTCDDSAGVAWSATTEPGWRAELLVDAGGVPGAVAPKPVPSGPFTGWLGISANATVPLGTQSATTLFLIGGSDTSAVEVTSTTCSCGDPTAAVLPTAVPIELRVGPDGPNPSSRPIGIRLDLPAAGHARIAIHDVRGRLIWHQDLGELSAGSHGVTWDTRDLRGAPLSAGVYFVRLVSGTRTATGKLVLVD